MNQLPFWAPLHGFGPVRLPPPAIQVAVASGGSKAAGPPRSGESSDSYRGGLQGCPLRGVRPRRWLCGCRARTARRSRRRRFYARASRPASRLVHPNPSPPTRRARCVPRRRSCRPSFAVAFEHRLAHRAQGKACVPLQPVQMPFEGRDRRQVHRGPILRPGRDSTPGDGRAPAWPRAGGSRGRRAARSAAPPPKKRPRLPSAAWHRILTGGSRARVFQPGEYPAQWRGISGALPGSVYGRGRDRVSLAPA